jgi:hypothetical protein
MFSRARVAMATVGVGLAAVPAAAEAAAIVAAPCSRAVLGQKTVPIQGTGFTPNSFVSIKTADGQTLGGAATDPAGNFADVFFGSTLFPSINSTKLTTQLVATDSAGVAAPAIPFQMVKITATVPEKARPGSRVTYRVLGFDTGKNVYLHVRRGGKTRGTFKIAKAKGDCGIATRRLRYMPLRSYRTGTYDYYFQHTKKFDRTAPGVKLSISIVRRIRFG